MHKEIIDEESFASDPDNIYDSYRARNLYYNGEYGYRKLSLMKQENIEEASRGQSKYDILAIKVAVVDKCGYCFKEEDEQPDFKYHARHDYDCIRCPIYKRLGKTCYHTKEWQRMQDVKTKAAFHKYHKAWCKRLGLLIKAYK